MASKCLRTDHNVKCCGQRNLVKTLDNMNYEVTERSID